MARNAMHLLQGVNSLYFNGVNSYIDCGNSELFNSYNITWEILYTARSVTKRQHIFSKWQNNYDMLIDFSDRRSRCLEWQLNRYQSDNIYSYPLNEGQTYYIVVCADLTNMYMYIDGIMVSSKEMAYSPRFINDVNLCIGANNAYNNYFMHSDLYLFAGYNICWNEQKVAERYANIGSIRDTIPDNCILFFNCKEYGSVLKDLSGNGNDGILYNIESSIKRIRNMKNKGNEFHRSKKMLYKDSDESWGGISL